MKGKIYVVILMSLIIIIFTRWTTRASILKKRTMDSLTGGGCYTCYEAYGGEVCPQLVIPCVEGNPCSTQEECGYANYYAFVHRVTSVCSGGRNEYTTSPEECVRIVTCICDENEEGAYVLYQEVHVREKN